MQVRFGHRVLAYLVLFAAAIMPSAGHAQDSRLDTIVKRDKLIVAVMNSSRPTAFVDESGNLTGFEIELARLIAKDILGSLDKVEFVTTTVDGRFPAVLSGRADFGIASSTIYPDRAVRLAWTQPYLDSTTFVVVKKDSPITSIAGLDDSSVTFGSPNSAAMIDRVKRYAPKAHALYFDTESATFQALKSGRVTAVQDDSAQADFQVAQSDGGLVKLPGNLGSLNNNALFMKPGDFTLWLCLNTIVGEYTHGSRYGDYQALYHKWFGRDAPPSRPY